MTFEKVDRRGHVRIVQGDQGYCFHVPTDWEIRENLEEADVVCLAPIQSGFRDSVIARSLSAEELKNPEETVRRQLEGLGAKAEVLEPWSGLDKPVVVHLESKFSAQPLGQLLYLHQRDNGNGVLLACTTTQARLSTQREFFQDIVSKAHYDLKDCPGEGGLPQVFPTPKVTLSPAP